MKICGKCKKEKVLDLFPKNKTKPDGHASTCKLCRKEEQKIWYENNKQKVKDIVKQNKKDRRKQWKEYKETLICSYCSENNSCCLDFHHLDPKEKDFTISQKVAYMSWENIMEEVSKCIVVCKNCHAKIHDGLIKT